MKDENPWYTAEQKREIAEREVARRLAEYERLQDTNADLLAALEDANRQITDLCKTVNVLAGFRKVRAEDYAEKTRAAIAKAKAGKE